MYINWKDFSMLTSQPSPPPNQSTSLPAYQPKKKNMHNFGIFQLIWLKRDMSGYKQRQNLTFSYNKLSYIVILVSDKFWNKKFCTPDFFRYIKKWLQYKKFLSYARNELSYSIKHKNFSKTWEEKLRKLMGKIIILLLNEKFCIAKHMALILS